MGCDSSTKETPETTMSTLSQGGSVISKQPIIQIQSQRGGGEEGCRWSDDEDDEDDDSIPELTRRGDSSDSDSDEEDQYVKRIARKKVKTAGNPPTRVQVKTEWMSRSSTPLAGVNYTLCVPTCDPDVEELIPEAGADALDSNGLFSPDSNALMFNLSLNNRKKGPNHMRYGGYEYFKKNNGTKADLFYCKNKHTCGCPG
eukprot:scaffold61723_cov31-Cyclotella_meneghiniana.AAC.1